MWRYGARYIMITGMLLLNFANGADELLAKRIDYNREINSERDGYHQPTGITASKACPTKCYLSESHTVFCSNNPSSFVKNIKCTYNRNAGDLTMGNKESVSRIELGMLEKSLKIQENIPLVTGQISLYINLNMVYMDASVFRGLELLITEVRVFNMASLQPDSLLGLPHLRSFEIESRRVPRIVSDINSTTNEKKIPAFIRLRLADLDIPLSLNMDSNCHMCLVPNSTDIKHLVIMFKQNPKSDTSVRRETSKFSLIFPQTCPRKESGLGCDDQLDSETIISSASQSDYYEGQSDQAPQSSSLLIILSIWCTVLTIVLILVLCIIFVCTRYLTGHDTFCLWFLRAIGKAPMVFDEVSVNSLQSDYVNNRMDSNHIEDKYSNVIGEYRASLCSLPVKRIISKSVLNIKERPYRLPRYNSTLHNQRLRRNNQIRKSTGSQTDFMDIDPDLMLYASLHRNTPNMLDSIYPAPPMRCASQCVLSGGRLPNTTDAAQGLPSRDQISCKDLQDCIKNGFDKLNQRSYRLSQVESDEVGQSGLWNLPPLPPHALKRNSVLLTKNETSFNHAAVD